MADRPILFSAPMVLALLEGRKTQTRRTIKPQPTVNEAGLLVYRTPKVTAQGKPETIAMCMRIGVGDRLWVKERLIRATTDQDIPFVSYFADNAKPWWAGAGWQWKRSSLPSIHMPKIYSRLTLHVTAVRVQRLQEIDLADARAEGCEIRQMWLFGADTREARDQIGRDSYATLWGSINGLNSWAENPWVTALTFGVERRNIADVRAA